MSLQMIIGGSGYGKSEYLIRTMISEAMNHPDEQYYYIVPEQYTMAAQKQIVYAHENHGTFNIDIVSFQRLAYRIFEELSVRPKMVLEDTGKSMLIRKLLGMHKDELMYYQNVLGKEGFIDQVKSLLSEFYQYEITPDILDGLHNSIDQEKAIALKLHDMSIVFRAFSDYMGEHMMVAEQLYDVLASYVSDSALLKDCHIYMDEFTGFTPTQKTLLAALLKTASDVTCTLTMDVKALAKSGRMKDHDLFYMSDQTLRGLYDLAREQGVIIKDPILREETKKSRYIDKTDLKHLEENLFRFPYRTYSGDIAHINVIQTRTLLDEVNFAADQISYLVREKGYRYNEIALVSNELEGASRVIDDVFDRRGIPHFIDNNQKMMNNPCLETIDAMLHMFLENFSYASVFHYLKCGMSNLSLSEVERLENEARKRGIKGYHWWNKPFDPERSSQSVEDARRKFMEEISDIYNAMNQNLSVHDQLVCLYNYTVSLSMNEKLERLSEEYSEKNDYAMARAYHQVYDKLLLLMDKMNDVMGEESISLEEFIDIFEVGISDLSLGVIPPGMDQVVCGNLERTRLSGVKVMFIISVNDGIVPKSVGPHTLISDSDRDYLKNFDVTFAPSDKENSFTEQLYIYMAMTKASDRLYISYHVKGKDQKEIKPSYLIARLTSLFPEMKIDEYLGDSYDILDIDRVVDVAKKKMLDKSESAAFTAELMRQLLVYDVDESKKELYNQVLSAGFASMDEEILSKMMQGLFYGTKDSLISHSLAMELYGQEIYNSVSKLETYANCAYSFYLQYGLSLRERETFEVSTMDIGNLLHGVMEQIFLSVKNQRIDWWELSEEKFVSLAEEAFDRIAEQEYKEVFNQSKRHENQLRMLKRVVKRTAKVLRTQVQAGEMEPRYFEQRFGRKDHLAATEIMLNADVKMYLSGVVDRIDLYETDDKIYMKVIDYKSGNKSIDFGKIYHGSQLQLSVYLQVVEEILRKQYPNKEIVPAGMYYYHMSDPMLDLDKNKEEDRIKAFKMSGITNKDMDAVTVMEREPGLVLPVGINKDGSFRKGTQVLSNEEILQLEGFVQKKMTELGNRMIAGDISKEPVGNIERATCEYCSYRSICSFDPVNGKDHYTVVESMKLDEFLDKTKEADADGVDEGSAIHH